MSSDNESFSHANRPQLGSVTMYVLGAFVLLIAAIELIQPRLGSDKSHGRIGQARAIFNGPLGMQIDIYRTHMNHYPESLTDLITKPPSGAHTWQGPYIKDENSLRDPWGQPLRYRYPAQRSKQAYDLWSAGPDRVDFTEDDVTNYLEE